MTQEEHIVCILCDLVEIYAKVESVVYKIEALTSTLIVPKRYFPITDPARLISLQSKYCVCDIPMIYLYREGKPCCNKCKKHIEPITFTFADGQEVHIA